MSTEHLSLEGKFRDIVHSNASAISHEEKEELATRWWQTITSAYSESQRHYHTAQHIISMWDTLTSIPEEDVHDTAAVCFAICFHDIIYDPKAASEFNERESIKVWEEFAQEAGLNQVLVKNVSDMIEATIKHSLPKTYPEDLPLFLDLDLEVLGRAREHYARYASQIRLEYRHYSDDAYCKGRSNVLRHLNEGEIYFTEYWKSRLTAPARENLNWEIGGLGDGRIPNVK